MTGVDRTGEGSGNGGTSHGGSEPSWAARPWDAPTNTDSAEAKPTGPTRSRRSRRAPWLVAAALLIGAVTAGYWLHQSQARTGSPCGAAFAAAAAVPLNETNDAEMLETVKVCSGQEWLRELEAHPNALGFTTVTTQDEINVQSALCSSVEPGESQMCDDWNEALGTGK